MRTYKQKLNKHKQQCINCGLIEGDCLCQCDVKIDSKSEIWLLTHENELERTTNTGRLLEVLPNTRVFKWHRTERPQDLINLIESKVYTIYIVFSDDRIEEKNRAVSFKKADRTVFIILDGTWKEARKMLRKSPYLDGLPILPLTNIKESKYDLRRNKDLDHICTVEVGIALLDLIDEKDQAEDLASYFDVFLEKYHRGRLG